MNKNTTGTSPLQGTKVLVTALDLEQAEHRGIAVYSKAIIKHLNLKGAEVWLLTQFQPTTSDLKKLPKITQEIIFNSRTLNELVNGKTWKTSWLNRIPGYSRLINLCRWGKKGLGKYWITKHFKLKDLKKFRIADLEDNPNLRVGRLEYLKHVEGIVSLEDVYEASQQSALKQTLKPVTIDVRGFDVFIACCPLNIRTKNIPIVVQTIHDLIALEYAPHDENTRQFTHRLQACQQTRRIHVSSTTSKKFHHHISNKQQFFNPIEVTLVQPPSLYFPYPLYQANKQINDLQPTSSIFRSGADAQHRKPSELVPFRYFLFNSSVEARKNLLFLVKAFTLSGLGRQGIRLCVTGKLKSDSYSQEVKKVVADEPAILLTGYVDDNTKLDLYLNALGLLSPSLVEGFGIPVLDAACLGMKSIASACDSHREIYDLYDFAEHVLTLSILKTRDWSNAMKATAGIYKHLSNEAASERMKRIKRYLIMQKQIEEKFEDQIINILQK